MSVVTNVVCAFGLTDNEQDHELLQLINQQCNAGKLTHVNDHKLPPCWFCNGKTLEVNLAIGAFNHLNLQKWISNIQQNIPFQNFGCQFLQLIVQDQLSQGFGIIEVYRQHNSTKPFLWTENSNPTNN